jgi:hypothetical protein
MVHSTRARDAARPSCMACVTPKLALEPHAWARHTSATLAPAVRAAALIHRSPPVQGAPSVQGAAAVALAHCYSRPAVATPLFTAPKLLEKAMAHWLAVVDILSDSSARVVHSGMVAIDRMIAAHQAAVSARGAEQAEGLQSVLAHFAWAGAIRLRSAAAHVLDRMARMPAALQVRPCQWPALGCNLLERTLQWTDERGSTALAAA